MAGAISLHTADYVVAVMIVSVPMGIGLWYAVKDANRTTREEYLLGGRRMSFLPVAMSSFITYVSAITLMGYPAETYFFGAIAISTYIGITACYLFGSVTFVPLLHKLQLTSVYEYIERRYQSKTLHMVSTIIGMLNTILYQAIVLLSPALALQACADLPLWMSIAVIGTVGTIYTAIGGFKSVIWTDTFQTVMIFVGIFANIIKACIEVGGVGEVWRLAEQGGRINMDKFSLDLRVRHTHWSLSFGFFFMWSSNCLSQASVQRISSIKHLRDAKLVFLLNVPLQLLYGFTNFFTGLAIYAFYSIRRCDPYEDGLITNENQLVPYFVLHTMTGLPGMAGLFTGVLCCGSLSTLSSGINAMAANTVEDLLRRPLRSVKEATITFITKLFVVVYGVTAVGLAYMAQSLDGPVTQMAAAVFGAFGSPILGVIVMGSFVPWANKYGALAGVAVSLIFNLWISIGSVIQATPLRKLPPITTENCFELSATRNLSLDHHVVTHRTLVNKTFTSATEYTRLTAMVNNSTITTPGAGDTPFSPYDISYEWYTPMGCIVCIVTGLIVSFCTNLKHRHKTGNWWAVPRSTVTDEKYIIPCLRRFWGMGHQTGRSNNLDPNTMDSEQARPIVGVVCPRDRKVPAENVETELENLSPLFDN